MPWSRVNSTDFTELVKDYYPVEEDEEYWAILDEIKTLPLLGGMVPGKGKFVLTAMAAPGKDGMGILMDRETESAQFFNVLR